MGNITYCAFHTRSIFCLCFHQSHTHTSTFIPSFIQVYSFCLFVFGMRQASSSDTWRSSHPSYGAYKQIVIHGSNLQINSLGNLK